VCGGGGVPAQHLEGLRSVLDLDVWDMRNLGEGAEKSNAQGPKRASYLTSRCMCCSRGAVKGKAREVNLKLEGGKSRSDL
jgi:hypothetical protein